MTIKNYSIIFCSYWMKRRVHCWARLVLGSHVRPTISCGVIIASSKYRRYWHEAARHWRYLGCAVIWYLMTAFVSGGGGGCSAIPNSYSCEILYSLFYTQYNINLHNTTDLFVAQSLFQHLMKEIQFLSWTTSRTVDYNLSTTLV